LCEFGSRGVDSDRNGTVPDLARRTRNRHSTTRRPPAAGGFDPLDLAMIMTELPLYALLIAWVFERANRSMAVALAFHAGSHLDHIERAPRSDLRLHRLHLAVLAVLAVIAGAAAWSLSRRLAVQRSWSTGDPAGG
jgi:hypothetical protein